MKNSEIISKLDVLVPQERKLTSEILALIREADRRRLYLDLGYPNIYKWLIEKYGYSQSAAHRRIQAARLLAVLPEVEEKLVAGSLNLTTLSQVQTTLRKEELRTGEKISVEAKRELVSKIEKKSSDEAQKLLVTEFPEAQVSESLRFINASESKLSAMLDDETRRWLERAKELMSHTHPNATWAEVIKNTAKEFVEQKDPLMKPVKNKRCKDPLVKPAKCMSSQTEVGTAPRTETETDAEAEAEARARAKSAPTHSTFENSALLTHKDPVLVDRALAAHGTSADDQPERIGWQTKKRIVLQRAGGACEFRDHASGKVCGSRFQIEVDHMKPRALGGGDKITNLRCLCRRHNILMAERSLGLERMVQYRSSVDRQSQ